MTSPKSEDRPRPRQDDSTTVIATGVLAATLATLCHETLGHGLGCVIDGGRITLLTSIWFRCHGATSLTDAAGPFASLVGGLAAFALLPRASGNRLMRFFLILFGAISLFWFAGQLIDHARDQRRRLGAHRPSQPLAGSGVRISIAHRRCHLWSAPSH